MLNLDQVRLLENRVEKAVGKIQTLSAENTHLRSQLSSLQARVNELEGLVRAFKDDQGRIEEGILNALDRLSAFEDSVVHHEKVDVTTHRTVTHIETVSPAAAGVTEESDSVIAPESEIADDPSPEATEKSDIEIAADWQNAPTAVKNSSSNGQMDIF